MTRCFKTEFCRWAECSDEEYADRVFWRCIYRHALLFALPIFRFKRSMFREDFDFVRDLAGTTSIKEAISELNRFYGRNVRDDSIARKIFLIRISGKRVLQLYRKVGAGHTAKGVEP